MNSLIKYSKLKRGYFEKIESIELLRALENNIKMGSNSINSSSFSIDVIEDYRIPNEWYHLCMTYDKDSKDFSVYINGSFIDNKKINALENFSKEWFYIGAILKIHKILRVVLVI